MESLQGKLLKGLHGLSKLTPYWGLLYELNIMPIMYRIMYKRMMLYHDIINSDERREIKKVVQEQEASGYERCWFGNLKSEGRTVDIEVREELVKGKKKSKWTQK